VAADATIYAGTTNNGSVDQQAVRTLLEAITGTGKRFLYTSGVRVLGDTGGKVADETWPTRPIALVAWRTGVEQLVLQAAQQRVLPIVIRPGLVYGRGAGIPAGFVQSARDKGAAQYVGTGLNHWPAIHVEDLADLYVRAIERATAGALFHAADDSKHTVKEIAEAASFGAGAKGRTESWPLEEARKTLGAYADALALDQLISSEKARTTLGWKPRCDDILDDLRHGSYTK
jgi:nucleoside-diphosphate-sugar epimerase